MRCWRAARVWLVGCKEKAKQPPAPQAQTGVKTSDRRFHLRIVKGGVELTKRGETLQALPGSRSVLVETDTSLLVSRLEDNLQRANFAVNLTVARDAYLCENVSEQATLLDSSFMMNSCQALMPGTVTANAPHLVRRSASRAVARVNGADPIRLPDADSVE